MEISYIYCTTLLIVLVVQASAFDGNISLTGDTTIGSNVAIKCSWTTLPNEKMLELTISSPAYSPVGSNNYIYQISETGNPYVGNQNNTRMSLDTVNVTSQSVTMRISSLQCSDERDYFCTFKSGITGASQSYVNYSTKLIVKARPKNPSITPNINADVMEQTNISVTCNANVGRPGLGSLQWRIYRNNVGDIILPGDSRIIETKNGTLQPGEDSCTQRIQQTFRMQVTRADQNLLIACFVQNNDFQTTVPDVCQNSTTDLCGKLGPFRIVYGVADVDVQQVPADVIYQGMTVRLTCQADGVPAPTYSWVKVGDENSTLSAEMVDGKSQLTLSNRVAQGAQEEYNCTATNTALGIPYSATSGLSFAVLSTTTSTSTTTTTTPTPKTTNGVSSGGPPVSGPQNKDDDDQTKTIIIVVVVVGSCIIIAIVIGIVCWRKRRAKKAIEEPAEKPYNNRTNLSFQNPQPDLVADKKFQNPTLDYSTNKTSLSGSIPSFIEKHEDGLMYADLTYDNKPRSRKPMAINDSSSDYSDIQMPQV